MSEKYHVPEWDCLDDILDVTKEIGRIASKVLLAHFVHTGERASNHDIEWLLQAFVQRNVTAVLELAARGLEERSAESPDGRIDIQEAIRVVRELDSTDQKDPPDDQDSAPRYRVWRDE